MGNKKDFLEGLSKSGNKPILNNQKNNVGRPTKTIEEKESESLILKITIDEMRIIKNKAGVMPLSTWLKNELRTKTDVFHGWKKSYQEDESLHKIIYIAPQ